MAGTRIEKPYPPVRVAEGHRSSPRTLSGRVGRGLWQLCERGRASEAAEEIAHGRARPRPREQLIVFCG